LEKTATYDEIGCTRNRKHPRDPLMNKYAMVRNFCSGAGAVEMQGTELGGQEVDECWNLDLS
jgi:hypothetical protein